MRYSQIKIKQIIEVIKMAKSIQYFNVQGTIVINKEKINFSKVIRAATEDEAKNKVFIHYGSKHNIKRQLIKFSSVKTVKNDQVEDTIGQELSGSFQYLRG